MVNRPVVIASVMMQERRDQTDQRKRDTEEANKANEGLHSSIMMPLKVLKAVLF